jgi:hypothetical protein
VTELLNWITTYGESLSVVTILLIVLAVIVVGLYKRWWVPGWMYADCIEKNKVLESAADAETDRMRIRLEALQDTPPPRRRTRE